MRENFTLLRYAAAGSTLIAGILHLSLVENVIERNLNTGILFLIGGLAQVFWVFLLSEAGIKFGTILALEGL